MTFAPDLTHPQTNALNEIAESQARRILELDAENVKLKQLATDRLHILERIEEAISDGKHIEAGSAIHLVTLANIVDWE